MSFFIIEREPVCNSKQLITAVLDSAADLEILGTEDGLGDFSPGSIAIIAMSGTPAYMLNASCEWKEM